MTVTPYTQRSYINNTMYIHLYLNFSPSDEICKKSLISGKTHVCKMLNHCKTAIQDIRDNVKYPTICSFNGASADFMPVVCCAPDSTSQKERLAKDDQFQEVLPGLTCECTII